MDLSEDVIRFLMTVKVPKTKGLSNTNILAQLLPIHFKGNIKFCEPFFTAPLDLSYLEGPYNAVHGVEPDVVVLSQIDFLPEGRRIGCPLTIIVDNRKSLVMACVYTPQDGERLCELVSGWLKNRMGSGWGVMCESIDIRSLSELSDPFPALFILTKIVMPEESYNRIVTALMAMNLYFGRTMT